MNRNFFKQFAIALILFLLGYFSFNGKLFAAGMRPVPAVHAAASVTGSSDNP